MIKVYRGLNPRYNQSDDGDLQVWVWRHDSQLGQDSRKSTECPKESCKDYGYMIIDNVVLI